MYFSRFYFLSKKWPIDLMQEVIRVRRQPVVQKSRSEAGELAAVVIRFG